MASLGLYLSNLINQRFGLNIEILVGPIFVSITAHKRPGPLNPQFKFLITLKYHLIHVKYITVPNERSIYKRLKRLAEWNRRVNDDDNVDEEEPEIEQIS
jgi:hypothetical protein